MAVLRLRVAPDPILRKKTNRVTKIDGAIQRFIDDMFETMHAASGVGLAANQVGVPLRVLVISIPESEEQASQEYALINAEFVKKTGERWVEEGCLSIPEYRGEFKRAEQVKVKGLDREGKEVRLKAEGLLAQALEHEIDHLNGILYIDRMKEQGTLDTLRECETSQPVEIAPG